MSPEIADGVDGRIEVLFDGGRPYLYLLGAGGEAGVERCYSVADEEALENDFQVWRNHLQSLPRSGLTVHAVWTAVAGGHVFTALAGDARRTAL